MKTVQRIILSFTILIAGLPARALCVNTPEEILLPEGIAGMPYQINIEAVLREKYQLKLESDGRTSAFRWSSAGGEVPSGMVVRPTGVINGTPKVARNEPYRFRVMVKDVTYAGSEGLILDLRLTVTPPRIRLTQIKAPRLSPITNTTTEQTQEDMRNAHANQNIVGVTNTEQSVSNDQTPQVGLQNGLLILPAELRKKRDSSLKFEGVPARTNRTDVSFDPGLIKPVLDGHRVELPEPISALISKGKKQEVINVGTERIGGNKIRGPAKIKLKNVNVLRYDVRVGQTVTFPAAPDLSLPFIPPVPAQSVQAVPDAFLRAAARDPIPAAFGRLAQEFNDIESDKAQDVNTAIAEAIDSVNGVVRVLEALVAGSDSVLTTGGGPLALITSIRGLIEPVGGATPIIDQALSERWPDSRIEELLGRLEVLRNNLLALRTIPVNGGQTWTSWYTQNQVTYEGMLSRIGELKTQLIGLRRNSPEGIAFLNAQNQLLRWKPILIGVRDAGVAGFEKDFEVGCGFAFDTGKETNVKLIKRDRLAAPGTATTEEEIVTVVCSSPLSVSAGFGFSNVDEKEFVLVPSTKTVTVNGQPTEVVISRFGFKNRSAFRTLPVLLLNTRVWEPNDTFALHVSTGAAVDVKTGQGGTDLEYLVGPSISFWRSLFITTGLHIGRVNKLAGGFELDQEVPTGIGEPPIEKAWKKGFVTTLTYKIK